MPATHKPSASREKDLAVLWTLRRKFLRNQPEADRKMICEFFRSWDVQVDKNNFCMFQKKGMVPLLRRVLRDAYGWQGNETNSDDPDMLVAMILLREAALLDECANGSRPGSATPSAPASPKPKPQPSVAQVIAAEGNKMEAQVNSVLHNSNASQKIADYVTIAVDAAMAWIQTKAKAILDNYNLTRDEKIAQLQALAKAQTDKVVDSQTNEVLDAVDVVAKNKPPAVQAMLAEQVAKIVVERTQKMIETMITNMAEKMVNPDDYYGRFQHPQLDLAGQAKHKTPLDPEDYYNNMPHVKEARAAQPSSEPAKPKTPMVNPDDYYGRFQYPQQDLAAQAKQKTPVDPEDYYNNMPHVKEARAAQASSESAKPKTPMVNSDDYYGRFQYPQQDLAAQAKHKTPLDPEDYYNNMPHVKEARAAQPSSEPAKPKTPMLNSEEYYGRFQYPQQDLAAQAQHKTPVDPEDYYDNMSHVKEALAAQAKPKPAQAADDEEDEEDQGQPLNDRRYGPTGGKGAAAQPNGGERRLGRINYVPRESAQVFVPEKPSNAIADLQALKAEVTNIRQAANAAAAAAMPQQEYPTEPAKPKTPVDPADDYWNLPHVKEALAAQAKLKQPQLFVPAEQAPPEPAKQPTPEEVSDFDDLMRQLKRRPSQDAADAQAALDAAAAGQNLIMPQIQPTQPPDAAAEAQQLVQDIINLRTGGTTTNPPANPANVLESVESPPPQPNADLIAAAKRPLPASPEEVAAGQALAAAVEPAKEFNALDLSPALFSSKPNDRNLDAALNAEKRAQGLRNYAPRKGPVKKELYDKIESPENQAAAQEDDEADFINDEAEPQPNIREPVQFPDVDVSNSAQKELEDWLEEQPTNQDANMRAQFAQTGQPAANTQMAPTARPVVRSQIGQVGARFANAVNTNTVDPYDPGVAVEWFKTPTGQSPPQPALYTEQEADQEINNLFPQNANKIKSTQRTALRRLLVLTRHSNKEVRELAQRMVREKCLTAYPVFSAKMQTLILNNDKMQGLNSGETVKEFVAAANKMLHDCSLNQNANLFKSYS